MKLTERAEEILESMWIAIEEEGRGFADIESLGVTAEDPALLELTSHAFVEVHSDRVLFRPEGRAEGEDRKSVV